MRKFIYIAIAITIIGLYSYLKKAREVAANSAQKRTWPAPVDESKQPPVAADLASRNYYIIFDGSGSMERDGCSNGRSKIDVAKESLEKFAANVPETANLGLAVFDARGVAEEVPLGRENRSDFIAKVKAVFPGGATPLKSAMALGSEKLEEQARRQLAYGEYNLVVVTDGEASAGEDPRSIVADLLLNSPVVVHTIGFCISGDHSLNQPGKTVYKAANEPEQLTKGLEEVLAESETFDVATFGN